MLITSSWAKGRMYGHLKQLVSPMALTKHMTFAGFVPDDELAAHYRACDLSLVVSHEDFKRGDMDGFGIVYLEARYFGKPVVVSRSGGVPDAAAHEQIGLLVCPQDSREVGDAIALLLRDAEYASQMGRRDRKRVMSSFSSSSSAQQLLVLLARSVLRQ